MKAKRAYFLCALLLGVTAPISFAYPRAATHTTTACIIKTDTQEQQAECCPRFYSKSTCKKEGYTYWDVKHDRWAREPRKH